MTATPIPEGGGHRRLLLRRVLNTTDDPRTCERDAEYTHAKCVHLWRRGERRTI